MVDEKPPPVEVTPPPVADAGVPAPQPADAEPVPAPELRDGAEALAVASERERWLRERFEKEHEVTLTLLRRLLDGLSGESRGMRFWRWLIDDLRPEGRIAAEPGRRPYGGGLLLRPVQAWLRQRGFDSDRRSPPEYVEPDGPPSGGGVPQQ